MRNLALGILITTAFALTLLSSTLSARIDEEVGLDLGERVKQKDEATGSKDGFLDLSKIIAHPLGFIPVIIPITEPAIGYGAAVGLVNISENDNTPEGQKVNPNIMTIGAMRTENGSEGLFGMHSGNWMNGKLQTRFSVGEVSANLDFYGIGQGSKFGPFSYNIDSKFIRLEGRYRIGKSRSMLGIGYIYGDIVTQFKSAALPPDFTLGKRSSSLGGIDLIYSFDSRDNVFTPNKGIMSEITATFHDPSLGASSTYQKVNLSTMYYRPINECLYFGLKGVADMSFGDAPFYQRPYVKLRGVPAMRDQGEHVAYAEAELRWQIKNRISLIGFAGIGVTSNSFRDLEWTDHVVAGGVGVRYEIARKQGLHMGLDVGFSEEDTAVYVVFGSSWMRP